MDSGRFDVWVQDCMHRIFPDQKVPDIPRKKISLQAAGNEVACFQAGICGVSDRMEDLQVVVTDIVSAQGKIIPKEKTDIFYAEYVPVHWNSWGSPPEDLEGKAPGFFPDPLLRSPWRGHWGNKEKFPRTIGTWIRVHIDASLPAGKYSGKVQVSSRGEKRNADFTIEVLPFSLPEHSHFLMTNWFFVGAILHFHKIRPLTEEFWKVVEIYAKNLSTHRQNVITTPLFAINYMSAGHENGPEAQLIDLKEKAPGRYRFSFGNFDRWAEIFFRNRFEIIEGGNLARRSITPTDIILKRYGKKKAEKYSFPSTLDKDYRNFLEQFLVSLRRHLIRKGWIDRFCLHISDEPKGEQLESYTSLARFVKKIAPEFKLMDAMFKADLAKFAQFVDWPVPQESRYEQLLHESGIPRERMWFYYCSEPTGEWPNRFIDYTLIRVRIFTWLAFKYKIKGFLHWGLNHWTWHPPYYRAEIYNPYDNTTGGSLEAGDSYVLYPPRMPADSHEPVDSIRWEIIRKAMEDYEYLYLLRELLEKGEGSTKLIKQGNKLMKEFEEKIVPGFTNHTRDAAYLEDFRRRMARLIVKLQQ
ncbi:MAG TPA: DUF4091 domain-containing protein [bacterium]|nr:DUF4091 domain-containing protein [bacterium]